LTSKGKNTTRKAATLNLNSRALADVELALSPQMLQLELDQLQQASELSAMKKAQNTFSTKDRVAMVADQFATHQTEKSSLADTLLSLIEAAERLPQLLFDGALLDSLARFVDWQAGHHLLSIYHWYLEDGPNTADQLFDMHRDNEDGKSAIAASHPSFALLVEHIMTYVTCAINSKPSKAKKPSKKAKITNDTSTDDIDGSAAATTTDAETSKSLRQVPRNLFGLYPSANAKASYTLRPIKQHSISTNPETKYACAKKLFLDLLSDVIIVERAKDIDKCLNTDEKKGSGDKAKDLVRDRIVVRGGVLHSVVKVFGGDDGILASQCAKLILRSPARFFHGNISKDADLAAMILADEHVACQHLVSWLEQRLHALPTISPLLKAIADLVWKNNQALYTATVMPHHNTQALGARTRKPPDLPSTGRKSKKTKNVPDSLPSMPLTREALIPNPPGMVQLALVIREALNSRRGHHCGNEYLSRILNGQHPMTGQSGYLRNGDDLDQFMPIRWNNGHATLVRKHFTFELMLTTFGITNILIFMSTGQGYDTRDFVNSRTPNFAFFKLSEVVEYFDITIRTSKNPKSFKKIRFENQNIWGTACSQFQVHVNNGHTKLTTEEKFAPFFSATVQDAWIEWLGPLANIRLDDLSGVDLRDKLKSWQSAYDFVVGLGLSPFGSGVTPMQFANTLALLGLCLPPTVEEMARCINADHHPKGAIRGLKQLGFNIDAKPNEWVIAALQCVYDHLEHDLSFADKHELGFLFGFGAMFIEHLLCKISRFEGLFPTTGMIRLTSLAREELLSPTPFICGANLNDNTGLCFPISLTCATDSLDASVEASKLV
jgi:hypothetical protein